MIVHKISKKLVDFSWYTKLGFNLDIRNIVCVLCVWVYMYLCACMCKEREGEGERKGDRETLHFYWPIFF